VSSRAMDIKDLLVTADVGRFNITELEDQSDWSINVSKRPDKPDRCITLYDSGGRPPNPAWLVDYPTVQAIIRGSENDYTELTDKVLEVKDALLGLDSQTINGNIWVSVSMLSEAAFLGYDENRRPSFSLNFQLIINPSSGTHRKSL